MRAVYESLCPQVSKSWHPIAHSIIWARISSLATGAVGNFDPETRVNKRLSSITSNSQMCELQTVANIRFVMVSTHIIAGEYWGSPQVISVSDTDRGGIKISTVSDNQRDSRWRFPRSTSARRWAKGRDISPSPNVAITPPVFGYSLPGTSAVG